MVCLLREKNQLEQVQICSKLEIILTFSRKCLFYRIFTLPIFTLHFCLHLYLNSYIVLMNKMPFENDAQKVLNHSLVARGKVEMFLSNQQSI